MIRKIKQKLLLLATIIFVVAENTDCDNENALIYKEAEGSIVGYCKNSI